MGLPIPLYHVGLYDDPGQLSIQVVGCGHKYRFGSMNSDAVLEQHQSVGHRRIGQDCFL